MTIDRLMKRFEAIQQEERDKEARRIEEVESKRTQEVEKLTGLLSQLQEKMSSVNQEMLQVRQSEKQSESELIKMRQQIEQRQAAEERIRADNSESIKKAIEEKERLHGEEVQRLEKQMKLLMEKRAEAGKSEAP